MFFAVEIKNVTTKEEEFESLFSLTVSEIELKENFIYQYFSP